ncbi:GNAT family N-acetyltransferase [Granulicella sp. 5B5]|uniref:GNAT family N-acetyltransferase n=1 Tax=Granulicella sp. 5B5 TaxID=1617967 RepID=UPI0015F72049|nr:GNAT family N-acetyltransferase [Granulicella sp. 5B5]QMV18209.1 GNAT family N-acetyltransferase [Granulicella sp. 5B5]
MTSAPQLDVLDLRHFSASQLHPLLREEAARWQNRLQWDYAHATNILLDYLEGRILPGLVAVDTADGNRILGYAFHVFEGSKAVIGDIYAFGETESTTNPVGDLLLRHTLETLQATPGVDRIESQLLMYPAGALAAPFREHHFRAYPRLFMVRDLTQPLAHQQHPSHTDMWSLLREHNLTLHTWHPAFYEGAAGLIHRCYAGHMDAEINDQYKTFHGAQRFLHNIIRFPGCGIFDAEDSWVLRDAHTAEMKAMLLCSRIRYDVGHITQICVAPALRGNGLGELLLNYCAAQGAHRGLTSLSLTVTEANIRAQCLYSSNGFTQRHRFEAMVWDR